MENSGAAPGIGTFVIAFLVTSVTAAAGLEGTGKALFRAARLTPAVIFAGFAACIPMALAAVTTAFACFLKPRVNMGPL